VGFFEAVYCVGKNDRNQRGVSPSMEAPFGFPASAVDELVFAPTAVAVGTAHGCALGQNKASTPGLYCWGAADKGQIGSTTETGTNGVATLVPGLGGAELLRAGGRNTCVSNSGVVSCWGDSTFGQLGKIDSAPHPLPTPIPGLPAVRELSVGGEHLCAIVGGSAMQPGEVRCWGNNRNGQLGDGVDLALGYSGDPAEQFIRKTPVKVREVAN
jgi:alpha-tubulin suppressor-like RCC1 family protein